MSFRQLNPHISVDCVVFGYGQYGLKVLLVERSMPTGVDIGQGGTDLKLPGGLVYNDELLHEAAQRVLLELTGLENIFLERFDVLDSLDRISNSRDREWLEQTTGMAIDRVISVGYYGLASLDKGETIPRKANARWVSFDQTDKLPFDHSEIIQRAHTLLKDRLITGDLVFRLLPKKFTIKELQQVFQVCTGEKLDSRNFRKKLRSLDFIVPLDEKQARVAHKPARLYKFDKKRFTQFTKVKRFGII